MIEYLRKNSSVTCFAVASEAMAFAPFSQNSVAARWSSGSGQAQEGQSKPSNWLSSSMALVPRMGPAVAMMCFIEDVTAGRPAAQVFGSLTFNLDSSCELMWLRR